MKGLKIVSSFAALALSLTIGYGNIYPATAGAIELEKVEKILEPNIPKISAKTICPPIEGGQHFENKNKKSLQMWEYVFKKQCWQNKYLLPEEEGSNVKQMFDSFKDISLQDTAGEGDIIIADRNNDKLDDFIEAKLTDGIIRVVIYDPDKGLGNIHLGF